MAKHGVIRRETSGGNNDFEGVKMAAAAIREMQWL